MQTNIVKMEAPQVQSVALGAIRPSPENARKYFDENLLAELAESIKQVGIINPITARRTNGSFEIVAGERRYHAAKIAGLKDVPIIVVNDKNRIDQVRAIENLQREDLQPLEEADGYSRLSEKGVLSPDEIARKVGKSETYVARRLSLLGLCPAGKKALSSGRLTLGAALLIARLPSRRDQEELVALVLDNPHRTVEDISDFIRENFTRILGKAPFNPKDAKLVPRCGACTVCPKRTGHQVALFDDMKAKDSCLDGACFKLKVAAAFKRLAKTEGTKTLSAEETTNSFSTIGRLHYNAEWLDVDERSHDLDGARTPRDAGILNTLSPTHALVGDRIVTLVRKDEFRKLIAQSQPKATAAETRNNATAQEAMKREREQQELRRRISSAQFTATAAAKFPETREVWHALVTILIGNTWADTVKDVTRRRGIQFKGFDYAKPLAEYIKKLDIAGLKSLLLEILFTRTNKPAEACALVGVNAKTIAAKATDAFRSEKKAKRTAPQTKQKSSKSARKAARKKAVAAVTGKMSV